jgi:hypothetical protein
MTLGKELRQIRDNAVEQVENYLKSWFEAKRPILLGAAQNGSDCIEIDEPEDMMFWQKIYEEYEYIVLDFCVEQEIEIEFTYDSQGKTLERIAISWNEMFAGGPVCKKC